MQLLHSNNQLEILNYVKHLLWDKQAIKELGEPIVWQEGQQWLLKLENNVMTGFMTYKETPSSYNILYLYVLPDFRRLGVASDLYKGFEETVKDREKPIRALATHMSLAFFQIAGFELTLSYKNYFKVEKK